MDSIKMICENVPINGLVKDKKKKKNIFYFKANGAETIMDCSLIFGVWN